MTQFVSFILFTTPLTVIQILIHCESGHQLLKTVSETIFPGIIHIYLSLCNINCSSRLPLSESFICIFTNLLYHLIYVVKNFPFGYHSLALKKS